MSITADLNNALYVVDSNGQLWVNGNNATNNTIAPWSKLGGALGLTSASVGLDGSMWVTMKNTAKGKTAPPFVAAQFDWGSGTFFPLKQEGEGISAVDLIYAAIITAGDVYTTDLLYFNALINKYAIGYLNGVISAYLPS